MVVYKQMYLEAHINREYTCLKNNIAQLYFYKGKSTYVGFFQYI